MGGPLFGDLPARHTRRQQRLLYRQDRFAGTAASRLQRGQEPARQLHGHRQGPALRLHPAGSGEPLPGRAPRADAEQHPDMDEFCGQLARIHMGEFALDVDESHEHLRCFALPIRLDGQVDAAVSVSMPAFRLDEDKERWCAPACLPHAMPWSGISPRQATAFQANSRLSALVSVCRHDLHILSRDKENSRTRAACFGCGVASYALTAPDKSALGKDGGRGGKDDENAFSRSAAKKAGPSRAGGDPTGGPQGRAC